jgi:hypothetical protein
MAELPNEKQRLEAVDTAQRLGFAVLHAVPNSATALLVAVFLIDQVEQQMGTEETQRVLAEALRVAREHRPR